MMSPTASTWTTTDPLEPTCTGALVSGYQPCVFSTVGTWTVYATDGPFDTPGSAVVTVTSSGVSHFSVNMSAFYDIPPFVPLG